MRQHIPPLASAVLPVCSTAQHTYVCSSRPGNAVCEAEGRSWVGVGGSVGQGTRYPRDCHLQVTMTCWVTCRNLGGLGPWLLLTGLMYMDAPGNGLSLASVVWTDQAESRSGATAHLQHHKETEGNQSICVLTAVLYPDRCARGYSVLPCHGSQAAVVKGESHSSDVPDTSETSAGHKPASAPK